MKLDTITGEKRKHTAMLDIILHRVPWAGDKIRLYRHAAVRSDVFIGEYFLKIRAGNVLVLDNTDRTYIRRDLPKWSQRFGCWEYWYAQ